MSTRNGKIARCPNAIRDQLNQKLRDGLEAAAILPWLNSLPEVQSVLAEQFKGFPVNDVNLSAWRTGGYQDWLRRREAHEFITTLDEAEAEAEAPPSDAPDEQEQESPVERLARKPVHKLMRWLVTQYIAEAAELSTMESSEERWTRLRQLSADLSRLASADLKTESLRLQHERLKLARAKLQQSEFQFRMRSITPGLFAAMAGLPPKHFAEPKPTPPSASTRRTPESAPESSPIKVNNATGPDIPVSGPDTPLSKAI
jgi:hypothetical protein